MDERLIALMHEFLLEIESLIEEDDGTVFQMRHIEMHEELTDLIEEK